MEATAGIALGVVVRDIVTGFKGLAVSRIESLFTGPEIRIQPQELSGEGQPQAAIWFEESRVEVVP